MVSLLLTLHDHRNKVYWCAFSPTRLGTCSGDKTMRTEMTSRSFRSRVCQGYGVHCYSFSLMAKLQHPGRSPVRVCSLSPDSSPCYLDMKQLHAEEDANDLGVTCCHFAPQFDMDGSSVQFRLASCGQDSQLKIWIVSQHLEMPDIIRCQCYPLLLYNSLQLYASNTLNYFPPSLRFLTACAFSPTLPWMVTGSMDKTVNICHWQRDSRRHVGKPVLPSCVCACSPGTGRKLSGSGHSRLLVSDWPEDVSAWLSEESMEELVTTTSTSVGLRGKVLRKVEALKAALTGPGAPDEFLCPITREVLKDPVIAAAYTYRPSPMTNLPLPTILVTPNRSLKTTIGHWTATQ
uniref:U-box domain-containing protein n=1 Tax=Hucho hucho TaxID=62062 RepID=A0A4W5KZU0_9TELE